MNLQHIEQTLNDIKPGSRVLLTGYRSASEGTTADYLLEQLGPDGYNGLVQASLDLLNSPDLCPKKPEEFSGEIWTQAITEKRAAFEKRLRGEVVQRNSNIVKTASGHLKDPAKPDVVYMQHMRCLKREVRQGEEKQPRGDLARAKKALEEKLPIGGYRGLFALSPDRIDNVEMVF